VIKKVKNAGIHVTYGYYRKSFLDDKIFNEVIVYSLYPWKDIEKMIGEV